MISIHALLTESDRSRETENGHSHNFNPRSPHGERLQVVLYIGQQRFRFQSTLSSRRATDRITAIYHHQRISIHALLTESDDRLRELVQADRENFNPRSPHGERHRDSGQLQGEFRISIHALLTESDLWRMLRVLDISQFQSTLSSRRATCPGNYLFGKYGDFNPRSPHGERPLVSAASSRPSNFNPRSPHGERQQIPPNWPYRFCLKCQF